MSIYDYKLIRVAGGGFYVPNDAARIIETNRKCGKTEMVARLREQTKAAMRADELRDAKARKDIA